MQWSVQGQQSRAVNLHIIQNVTYTLACNVTCAALMFNACIGAAAAWALHHTRITVMAERVCLNDVCRDVLQ
jgi:hypothetical protein